MKFTTFFFFLSLVFTIPGLLAQEKEKRNFELDLSLGYLARTSVFYEKNIGVVVNPFLVSPSIGYFYQKGINGTGINMSLIAGVQNIGVGFRYSSTIRYDFLKISQPSNEHSFYFDHHFSTMKYFDFKNKKYKRPVYIGIGYSLINNGAEVKYEILQGQGLRKIPASLALDFDAYHIFLGLPIWKFYLEPGVYVVDDDFPGPVRESATIFYLEVLYRFHVL